MAKKKTDTKSRYFEVQPLLKKYPSARYYFIVGGRGTGKTYPVLKECIRDAIDGKGVFAYVRRYKESLKEADLNDLVGAHNNWVDGYTGGQWNRVVYYRSRFYLERWRENDDGTYEKEARNPNPIGGAWSLNTWEHQKGPDFAKDRGGMAHIVLDEALSKGAEYLRDEWGIYQNVLASLVRDRWEKDTKCWLLANPVTKWRNPYMSNMGITTQMLNEPGITELTYPTERGAKPMSAVFAYIAAKTDENGNVVEVDENRTNVYNTFFAFPNSKGKAQSITHAFWEMDDSARLPEKYLNDSTTSRTIYFKASDEDFFACDWCKYHGTNQYYMYFYHCDEILPDHYYFTLLPEMEKYAVIANHTDHRLWKVFVQLYNTQRLYYEDNEVADAFHGWIKESKKRVA